MRLSKQMIGFSILAMMGITSAHAADLDGQWFVTKMACNGERANPGTKDLYTPPNSISVAIHGSTGAFIDIIDGCRKTIPLAFTYSGEDQMTGAFNGPIECFPSNCSPACGLDLPLTVTYDVEFKNNSLIWNSIGPVDDNCAKSGQSEPITYWMHKRPGMSKQQ